MDTSSTPPYFITSSSQRPPYPTLSLSPPSSVFQSSGSLNGMNSQNTHFEPPPRPSSASAPLPSPSTAQPKGGQYFAALSPQSMQMQMQMQPPHLLQHPHHHHSASAPSIAQPASAPNGLQHPHAHHHHHEAMQGVQGHGQGFAQQLPRQQDPYMGVRGGANPGAMPETAPFLRDLNLVAEAAKRAQMAVLMRDLEGVDLS